MNFYHSECFKCMHDDCNDSDMCYTDNMYMSLCCSGFGECDRCVYQSVCMFLDELHEQKNEAGN